MKITKILHHLTTHHHIPTLSISIILEKKSIIRSRNKAKRCRNLAKNLLTTPKCQKIGPILHHRPITCLPMIHILSKRKQFLLLPLTPETQISALTFPCTCAHHLHRPPILFHQEGTLRHLLWATIIRHRERVLDSVSITIQVRTNTIYRARLREDISIKVIISNIPICIITIHLQGDIFSILPITHLALSRCSKKRPLNFDYLSYIFISSS